ncbi:MAG TPA: hypothetical protein VFA75_15965 [Nevskia sp.]|nr:hypothetical protein [Nevskia sp.]
MNEKALLSGLLLLSAAAVCLAAGPAHAAGMSCSMKYTLSGWSVFYKTASGRGTVTCSDGSTMNVKLRSEGGGLTFGKSTIDNGRGEFSGVRNIRDVLGDYAQGGAHGGAGDAAGVMGLTKGEVSLSLKGEGRGIDAGVDVGKFTISEIPDAAPEGTAAAPQPQ